MADIETDHAVGGPPIDARQGRPAHDVAALWQAGRWQQGGIQLARIAAGDDAAPAIHQLTIWRERDMRDAGRADLLVEEDAYDSGRAIDGRAIDGVGANHKGLSGRLWGSR